MREKLTLEQFREKRRAIQDLITSAENYISKNDGKIDIDEYELEILNQYLDLQDDILSYDLSDIPFEAWDDYEIGSTKDRVPDFTGTNANIDYDMVILDFDANYK